MTTIYVYNNCSTCKEAIAFLKSQNIDYTVHEFVKEPISFEQLKNLFVTSNQTIDQVLNKSGQLYKKMNLKEKLVKMTNDEVLKLMSENPMLIKRPILASEKQVIFGFNKIKQKSFKGV